MRSGTIGLPTNAVVQLASEVMLLTCTAILTALAVLLMAYARQVLTVLATVLITQRSAITQTACAGIPLAIVSMERAVVLRA